MLPKLFVHIPKNAGMTIRKSPQLAGKFMTAVPENHKSKEYTLAVTQTMDRYGDHHGYEHARFRDWNPNLTSSYDAFAVIRNPWDRVVSRYFFAKKVIEVEQKSPPDYADVSSFEAFLEERHKWGDVPYMWHRAVRGWYPAFDHVSDEEGNIRCDCLRFEKLDLDLKMYFKVTEMSKPRNVTALNTGTYRDIYTDKTIQIIADWYKKDIDTWGFDFDTGATKNYWSQSL